MNGGPDTSLAGDLGLNLESPSRVASILVAS
jgi:hypothetical protein